jgi:nucleoid-associated protein YgaU
MASNYKGKRSKKAAKKTARKAAPKAAKKTVRKAAARPARAKKAAPPQKQESFPAVPPPQEEEYRSEDTILLQKQELKGKKGGGRNALMAVVTVLVVLVVVIIVLLQTPASRRWIGRYTSLPGVSKSKVATVEKTPVQPLPAEAVTKMEKAPEQKGEGAEYYTVQVKDDLVGISEKLFHDYSKWREIYLANRDIIKDPALIYPGQKLKIPISPKTK